jgi:hypothetical protein
MRSSPRRSSGTTRARSLIIDKTQEVNRLPFGETDLSAVIATLPQERQDHFYAIIRDLIEEAELHREFYELVRFANDFDQGHATLRVDEFFREGELVSLRLEHYNFFGTAYPNYGVTSLNFAGAEIGKLELTELIDTSTATLEFVKDLCSLAIATEVEADRATIADIIDLYVESDYWQVFSQFTFDKEGLVFNLSPYQSFPHVFASHEVRIPWPQLAGKLSPQFCRTKAAKRLGLSNHARPLPS